MKQLKYSFSLYAMFFLAMMMYQMLCGHISIMECIVWSAIMWFIANVVLWFVE